MEIADESWRQLTGGKATPRSNKSHQTELFETDIPPWELPAESSIATATIVFSEAPHGPYDYRIPDSIREKLKIGMRVHVPLGRRRKPITGWCTKIDLEDESTTITSGHF